MILKRSSLILTLAAVSLWGQFASAATREIMYDRVFNGGPTYGQLVEQFFSQQVFPRGASYKAVSVTRDNVICESVRTNGRGGYWIRCRARYSGRVFGIGAVAERARVHYDNGGIRVDLGGMRGAINTRSIGRWVKARLPKRTGPDTGRTKRRFYVRIKNGTNFTVNYRLKRGNGSYSAFSLRPGKTLKHSYKSSRQRYFRVSFDNDLASGGKNSRSFSLSRESYIFRKRGDTLKLFSR